MKIMHISPMYVPALGGAELHLKELSERLASRGHDVTVVTANVGDCWDLWNGRYGALAESDVINAVRVIRFRPDRGLLFKVFEKWQQLKGGYRSGSLLFTREGLELLSQNPRIFQTIPQILSCDADIIASMNWYWPPAYHTYLARKLKRFTLVGIPLFHTAEEWCNRAIYNRMLSQCDGVIVNTAYEGQFAQKRGAKRVEVAGVGIDPKAFEGCNGNEVKARYGLDTVPVVGFIGRQIPKKGVLILVQAMQTVWRWNDRVGLVLAGPRSPRGDVEAVIEKLPESQKKWVAQIGEFDEKEKGSIYDAFDVFALPSTEESFGIGYLEAWLSSKPVIGSRIGSTECVIREGIDGLLVDPHDPHQLGMAIIELLADRDKRDRMGKNGRAKTLAEFTWDKVTDKVESFYFELLEGKRANRRALAQVEGDAGPVT